MDIQEDLLILEEYDVINNLFPDYRLDYIIRNRTDHWQEWDEVDFLRRFRLTKSSTEYLLSCIINDVRHLTDRNHAIPPMNQLLMALRFYATGSFYQAIGDFGGVHKSTAGKIVKEVTNAIAALRPRFVNLPVTQEEISKTQQEFYEIARFPRAVAALDCTHVRIQSPGGDDAEVFRCRKGYFSINTQAMCNSNLLLTDVVARWPGASHDSNIFDNSAARRKIEDGLFGNGLILGDGGYPSRHYLITPLANPVTRAETLFNEAQIRSRNVIERCFGVWKRRFPVISVGMRCRLPLAQDIIISTAVLTNIARLQNNPEPPQEIVIRDPDVHNEIEQNNFVIENDDVRRNIIDYFGAF